MIRNCSGNMEYTTTKCYQLVKKVTTEKQGSATTMLDETGNFHTA